MQRFRIGAITDEFSPDIAVAANEMRIRHEESAVRG